MLYSEKCAGFGTGRASALSWHTHLCHNKKRFIMPLPFAAVDVNG
jgi:hypothetical protein